MDRSQRVSGQAVGCGGPCESCELGCPVCILSHLGSALLCFGGGFLSCQSSTVALGCCGVPMT